MTACCLCRKILIYWLQIRNNLILIRIKVIRIRIKLIRIGIKLILIRIKLILIRIKLILIRIKLILIRIKLLLIRIKSKLIWSKLILIWSKLILIQINLLFIRSQLILWSRLNSYGSRTLIFLEKFIHLKFIILGTNCCTYCSLIISYRIIYIFSFKTPCRRGIWIFGEKLNLIRHSRVSINPENMLELIDTFNSY